MEVWTPNDKKLLLKCRENEIFFKGITIFVWTKGPRLVILRTKVELGIVGFQHFETSRMIFRW